MKIFVWATSLTLLLACTQGNFNAGVATQSSEPEPVATENVEPVESPSTTTSETATPAEPKNIAPEEAEGTEQANDPVMIGGAFLVCVQASQVECRLDTANSRNIVVPATMKLEFFGNNQPVTFQAATVNGFRWRLANFTSTGPLRTVTLKVTSPAGVVWTYHNEFETEALQIGDGTNALQGCTQAFVQRSKLVGLKYEQTYTVGPAVSQIMIDLVGLCGVARANDSMIQLLDANGSVLFQRFLPTTQNTVSLNYAVTQLKPGTYTVRITPGDDIDIDDLFINSLGISSVR